MEITGSVETVCPQCKEPRLGVIANTETKKILLMCLCCDHKEDIRMATFRLSKKESLDVLDQVDRMIKDGLPPKEESPFWLEVLADNSHECLGDLL